MEFDAGAIVSTVQNYILAIAGAGVALLGLTIGLSAAWRYAKKFLKG